MNCQRTHKVTRDVPKNGQFFKQLRSTKAVKQITFKILNEKIIPICKKENNVHVTEVELPSLLVTFFFLFLFILARVSPAGARAEIGAIKMNIFRFFHHSASVTFESSKFKFLKILEFRIMLVKPKVWQ